MSHNIPQPTVLSLPLTVCKLAILITISSEPGEISFLITNNLSVSHTLALCLPGKNILHKKLTLVIFLQITTGI